MQWGVVWDWRNGRGRGWIIRSIRLHLGTLRGFSSALILLHAVLFFFQMRKAEHVTYNLEKKVYNVYNVISQIWKKDPSFKTKRKLFSPTVSLCNAYLIAIDLQHVVENLNCHHYIQRKFVPFNDRK